MVRRLLCFSFILSAWIAEAKPTDDKSTDSKARNSEHQVGLGFVLGAPTALSAKKFLSDNRAFDLGLGYTWGNSMQFFGDYLFLFPNAWANEDIQLTPYVGVGASLTVVMAGRKRSFRDDMEREVITAARFPLGISWMIPKSNFEIFVEIVPMLDIIPGLYAEFGAGIGARIYI